MKFEGFVLIYYIVREWNTIAADGQTLLSVTLKVYTQLSAKI